MTDLPPARRRQSRAEQQAETRTRLLDAAESLFASSGIGQTSIEEICETAGFSRGAFYSNFEDRDDLVMSLLQRHLQRSMDEVTTIYDDGPGRFIDGLVEREDRASEAQATASVEYVLYATRSEQGRARLRELNRWMADQTAEVASATLEQLGVADAITGEGAAKILLALDEGFALLRLIDPERYPLGIWGETVRFLADAVVAMARQQTED
ncbi:MAG: TetR/AcrR family transcriptional regulator [Actinomycetota bacterium]